MITSELISYIKRQLESNISKDLVVSKLIGAGWKMEDVVEGFLNAGSFYEYKEQIKIPILNKKDEIKSELIINNEESDKKKDQVKEESIKIELPKIETQKKEVQKVWIPSSVPVKEVSVLNIEKKREETRIEVQNIEIEAKKEMALPSSVSRFELKPTKENNDIVQKPIENSSKDISNIAMLASYQRDVLSLQKNNEEVLKNKSNLPIKWIILLIIILGVSTLAWAFLSGRLILNKTDIPFVEESSKSLILKNSNILSSLKSYKTETNIDISSPTFINLLSGAVVHKYLSSTEKDSFSINTLGIVNNNGAELLSDNFVTVKSSLFPDYINIDIKSNGSDLFVSIPDLSKAINKFVPDPAVVKINKEQFGLIPELFSKKGEERLKRINMYNLIYRGISSYINNENINTYNNLINNLTINEKGIENIRGLDTYHYSIDIDSNSSKNILSKVAGNFILNLSSEDNEKLNQMIEATKVNSFDIWIGKEDSNIYQYSVALDIPISTILDIGDNNISDNKLSISWKTTYYDFNIQNNLFMPSQFISAVDFANNTKKAQIKNRVFDIKELADNLFRKEKSYGVKSNLSGSCINPVSGSIFSPTGHVLGVEKEVLDITISIKDIIDKTNGAGFCYGTVKDWSFTIPVSESYDVKDLPEGGYKSFFCTDSTGAKEELTAFPKGGTCLIKVDSSVLKTNITTTPITPDKQ
jgi:hypothetical protein